MEEKQVGSLVLTFEEWNALKKSMWCFCERVLDGRGLPGEADILPQVLERYVDWFSLTR